MQLPPHLTQHKADELITLPATSVATAIARGRLFPVRISGKPRALGIPRSTTATDYHYSVFILPLNWQGQGRTQLWRAPEKCSAGRRHDPPPPASVQAWRGPGPPGKIVRKTDLSKGLARDFMILRLFNDVLGVRRGIFIVMKRNR
ncbi:hypothetical protein J6590_026813 [Homalodisca vitripennis]|nr:hypothetical protein J6590_026813 [Homalodisca vitripennis]